MEKTIQNLTKAFIGESQARNRYTMYGKIAKKEGYETISALFETTANQELEHAKWLMRFINELKKDKSEYDTIIVTADAPTIMSDTKENLKSAIAGEHHEFTSMYPEFAKIAQEENLPHVAGRLTAIAIAEANHKNRFEKVLKELENDTMFSSTNEVKWECRNCGYIHKGTNAPALCPACDHPKAYYEKITK